MKKSIFLLTALGAATLIATLGFSLEPTSRSSASVAKTDAQFLVRAAEINLEEIQFARLAQQKSSMMDVKELGKTIEMEHAKLLTDLTALADKKGVLIPKTATSETMEDYKDLNNTSEKKFSDEYCELVIKGHKEAVTLFEKASKESSDLEIRDWATATLPKLKAQLANAKACKEKCEKMY